MKPSHFTSYAIGASLVVVVNETSPPMWLLISASIALGVLMSMLVGRMVKRENAPLQAKLDAARAVVDSYRSSLRQMTEIAVSRASVHTLADLRTRISRLSLAPNLPSGVWQELCRLDSDLAQMGVPTRAGSIASTGRGEPS